MNKLMQQPKQLYIGKVVKIKASVNETATSFINLNLYIIHQYIIDNNVKEDNFNCRVSIPTKEPKKYTDLINIGDQLTVYGRFTRETYNSKDDNSVISYYKIYATDIFKPLIPYPYEVIKNEEEATANYIEGTKTSQ